MSASALPPGEHSYESIRDAVKRGRYRFARIRSASGRLHFLIGLSPEQLAVLRGEAERAGVGFILHGSRVSGPRLRQRELDPVLRDALPLASNKRTASATYPAYEGVLIEKKKIKEYGLDDPRTSDLTILLVDPKRPKAELDRVAKDVESRLRGLGCTFPLRVFASVEGKIFRSEKDFIATGADYLQKNASGPAKFPRARVERGFRELYARVNIDEAPFVRSDAANGVLSAALLSASFGLTLGFHPVIPVMGFAFGFCGRYLARLRAWISREPADTFLTNGLALAADAAIGILLMAVVINPVARFGIPFARIVGASLLHTLSKGSIRLSLDKKFSRGPLARQRLGVLATVSINFLQGLATAGVYKGSRAAAALQIAVAAAGLLLVFRGPLSRAGLSRPSLRVFHTIYRRFTETLWPTPI